MKFILDIQMQSELGPKLHKALEKFCDKNALPEPVLQKANVSGSATYPTLREDLNAPMYKIHRSWLRRTMLLTMTPVIIVCGAVAGIMDGFRSLYKDCW
jgi:hypothetical protein